jgi:hypothetical protein
MKKFVYLYIGGDMGMPADEAKGKKVMAAWMAWFDTLGKNLVDGGAPFGQRKTVGGKAASKATGYSIVQAADFKAAVAMTKTCPHLTAGDGIEILETTPAQM